MNKKEFIERIKDNIENKLLYCNGVSCKHCVRFIGSECEEIKEFLKEYKYNGEPLIIARKGGTFSEHSKEKMISIINDLFKLNDLSEKV